MNPQRRSLFILLATFLLAISTACAQPYVRTADGYRLGVIDNGRSRIAADLVRREDGCWIEGIVQRKPLVRGPMTGNIHIEARTPQGELVTAMDVVFQPPRIPSGAAPQARFAARLPPGLPAGTIITVRHRGDEGVRRFRETPAATR